MSDWSSSISVPVCPMYWHELETTLDGSGDKQAVERMSTVSPIFGRFTFLYTE